MSGSGTCFVKSFKGFLPTLLDEMFTKRKFNKDKMLELDGKYQKIKSTLDTIEQKKREDEIKKYDLLQLAIKKQLVACYGAFGQSAFRYYKVDIAEAITTTGRLAFQRTEKTVNDFISKITGVILQM